MKKLTTIFSLALGLNAFAAEITLAPEAQQSQPNVVESLRAINLPTQQQKSATPSRTERTIRKLNRGSIPRGLEGLSPIELPASAIEYTGSTHNLLVKTLAKAEEMGVGSPIAFFEQAAPKVLEISGQNQNEAVVRITVNRAVEVVKTIIGSIGRNTPEAARIIAAYYTDAFKMAQSYTTRQQNLILNLNTSSDRCGSSPVLIGDFGTKFAQRLFDLSATATMSQSAKAITLVFAVGYLGIDLNYDLRTSLHEEFQDILVNIRELQQEDESMKAVLNSLDNNQEPTFSAVAKLRYAVHGIIEQSEAATQKYTYTCH
jgi:hypothetical protein